jgi:hypothetical protein
MFRKPVSIAGDKRCVNEIGNARQRQLRQQANQL